MQWWINMEGFRQLLWVIALVSTVLNLIYCIFSIYHAAKTSKPESDRQSFVMLLGFLVFSWLNLVILHLYPEFSDGVILVCSVIISALVVLSILIFYKPLQKRLIRKTGKVLKAIPPHQAGTGKICLQTKNSQYELEAMTIGHGLPAGVPVRIVKVMKDGSVVVEASSSDPSQS